MMMMESGHHSLSIPVPNIIASSPSGGRFDFDDGGVYCGGWQDGKAHGHGVCTGPKNVGEYSGSWNFGFEMSGVYKWKNGAVYEGRWQNGKRHGVGVEYNGKWIYKGEWSQGFKGRYGVKASSNSAVKYEGTWANGLQDGYGSETYSDGGYYQGQMCRGLRHGYGVRKSAPYGDSRLNNPTGVRGNSSSNNNNNGLTATSVAGSGNQQQLGVSGPAAMIHSNSLQSQSSIEANSDDDSPKLEDGFKPNIERTLASKNGFVLVAKPLDVSLPKHYPSNLFHSDNSSHLNLSGASGSNKPSGAAAASSRRSSLTNRLASAASRIPGNNNSSSSSSSQNSSSIFSRGLRRLKKQKSTSDLADSHLMMPFSVGGIQHRQQANNKDHHSAAAAAAAAEQLVPFALSPEELDITDPTTVETYTGEWKQDKRNGHGLCERSDGLKYEGQWHNDMKCGYGVTTFKDGSKEEGKYKNNILIADSKVKRFLHFGSSNMRQRIDDAVKMAHQAQTMALKKAEIADTRAATARDKADQATTAALEADRDSQIAFSVARQYSDSQQQLGMAAAAAAANFQPQLAMAMQDYPTMFAPHLQQHHMGAFPQSANQNALQMRRQSQQQQQQQQFNRSQQQFDAAQQQQQDQMDQHQQMDAQQQQGKQFLGALEPFNGRRGSFRGGANVNLFAMNAPGGGGSRSSPFGASSSSQASAGGREPSGGALSAPNPSGRQATSHSDPFSDLFDHYKSSASSVSEAILPAGLRSRNRMLSKQTSLDIANARLHRTGAAHNSSRSLLRMSSMDHAEENQQQRQQQFQGADERLNPMEQQLKHLVTSGEELQRQQQTEKGNGGGGSAGTDSAADRIVTTLAGSGQTPSGGSSAYGGLPPSASAASTQNSSSAFYGHNQTATPSPDLQSNAGASRPSGQQRYLSGLANHSRGQQSSQAFAAQMPVQYHHQFHHHQQQQQQQLSNSSQIDRRARDVHSLADDQLYMAGSRRREATTEFGGDRSDFTNYDFVISSAPRMTRKVMRRTASLSRNTPIRSISETRAHISHQQLDSSMANLRQRSISPAAGSYSLALSRDHQSHVNLPSAANHDNHNFNQPPMAGGVSAITITEPATQPAANLNHVGACDDASAPSPTGHFTLDSSYTGSSSGSTTAAAHLRKPSLQVRYDPNDLGGLMTREEVAALSHAQREQKRLEAELAESRAKRPLLHLYLTIKEFLIHRKLILSVLMINICLFEMFANLIV